MFVAKPCKRLFPGLLISALLFFTTTLPLHAAPDGIGHTMQVTLDPIAGTMEVTDDITLPTTIRSMEFSLNHGMSVLESSLELERIDSRGSRHARYRVAIDGQERSWRIRYQGKPVFSGRKSLGGMPDGVLDEKGVYLDGSSAWYPLSSLPIATVDLKIGHPESWRALSVGKLQTGADGSHWQTSVPHDDLYLVAGPFTRFAEKHGRLDLSVWLLTDEPAFANRYLGLMGDYIDHYSELLGEYPFAKFAVVENPWQTGFGMPSFTLLGSRVLRLPFIPYTSLPHEIAHNWLGNGIWVDYRQGNWSEGLTAYLADHWMKERRGKGAQHRLKSLQRFSNYAADGKDKPLLDFISRHDDTSQAVGYDKSMMLFHMIRRSLGETNFQAALKRLWERHRFEFIGFEQALRTLLESRPDLLKVYLPWLASDNVPGIKLGRLDHIPGDQQHQLQLDIERSGQANLSFQLPIYVTTKSGKPASRHVVWLKNARQQITLKLDSAPLRVDIDPAFDVLRHLDRSEQAPALNQLFGGRTAIVIPSDAPRSMQKAWQKFAQTLQRRFPQLLTVDDTDPLPADVEHRILLGWDNQQLQAAMPAFNDVGQSLTQNGLILTAANERYERGKNSLVLVTTSPEGIATGFVGATTPKEVNALASKLPHYGSYGRLVFEAGTVKNLRKDMLSPRHSVLSRQLTETPVQLVLPPETILGASLADSQ
jgi:hypothetical protein